jgi:hypothetical protein
MVADPGLGISAESCFQIVTSTLTCRFKNGEFLRIWRGKPGMSDIATAVEVTS